MAVHVACTISEPAKLRVYNHYDRGHPKSMTHKRGMGGFQNYVTKCDMDG